MECSWSPMSIRYNMFPAPLSANGLYLNSLHFCVFSTNPSVNFDLSLKYSTSSFTDLLVVIIRLSPYSQSGTNMFPQFFESVSAAYNFFCIFLNLVLVFPFLCHSSLVNCFWLLLR